MSTLVYGILAVCAAFILSLFFWGKKFLTLPGKYRYPMLAALTGGMFFSIWWMQSEETKHEATFMDVCWVGGTAHYPDTPEAKEACPGGTQQLAWAKRTITVKWDLGPEFNVFKESHELAMKWWNKQLGWDQFVTPDDNIIPDVRVVHGSVSGTGAMSTSHTTDGDTIAATITVKRPGNIREWMLEEQHELGHVLGLAHDRSGIMKKSLDEGEDMKVWLLHDKDRDAIRALYSDEGTALPSSPVSPSSPVLRDSGASDSTSPSP